MFDRLPPLQTLRAFEAAGRLSSMTLAAEELRVTHGAVLPAWQGCRLVSDAEVFLMNWDEPDSFDGRYFGPLPISSVLGRAEPIWTFAED